MLVGVVDSLKFTTVTHDYPEIFRTAPLLLFITHKWTRNIQIIKLHKFSKLGSDASQRHRSAHSELYRVPYYVLLKSLIIDTHSDSKPYCYVVLKRVENSLKYHAYSNMHDERELNEKHKGMLFSHIIASLFSHNADGKILIVNSNLSNMVAKGLGRYALNIQLSFPRQ